MQCAAEPKYCAGVLGQLGGRATAQLRGNIARRVFFHVGWNYSVAKTCGSKQERSQDFSKGWAEVMEAKTLEKENLLVIRIAKEST